MRRLGGKRNQRVRVRTTPGRCLLGLVGVVHAVLRAVRLSADMAVLMLVAIGKSGIRRVAIHPRFMVVSARLMLLARNGLLSGRMRMRMVVDS